MSFSTVVMFSSWASGYVTLHIQSRLPSPEIGRVAAGRASGIKIPRVAWQCLPYSRSHQCSCCRPASGNTVRGVSERASSDPELVEYI